MCDGQNEIGPQEEVVWQVCSPETPWRCENLCNSRGSVGTLKMLALLAVYLSYKEGIEKPQFSVQKAKCFGTNGKEADVALVYIWNLLLDCRRCRVCDQKAEHLGTKDI